MPEFRAFREMHEAYKIMLTGENTLLEPATTGPLCRYCGEHVAEAQAGIVVCSDCLMARAEARKKGRLSTTPKSRECITCGAEMLAGRKYCKKCAKKRQNKRARQWQRDSKRPAL